MRATTTSTSRRIHVTEEDMARLRELVRASRESATRDQRHLTELDQELDRADVVAAAEISPDVVTMYSTVRVRDLESGATIVYTLVFPEEADIERQRISVVAPIGTALIGFRVGDEIKVTTPRGSRRLEVDDVLYQPERAAA